MERKGFKTLTNLLSKTAGLVFFSFLAISLGVVFGLLFEGWVKDQPGTPVDSQMETVDLPVENLEETKLPVVQPKTPTTAKVIPETIPAKPVADIKYKVRVGPYANRNEALSASKQLQTLGYPVYVGNSAPFAVQVGAFATQSNAEKLKKELTEIGYKSFIEQK